MSNLPRNIPLWLILIGASYIAMTNFGMRSISGLFVLDLMHIDDTRQTVAFALALQNLVWGLTQPFVAAIADKFGTARVLCAGAILYMAAFIITPSLDTPFGLYSIWGVLFGAGIAGTSFSLILVALVRILPSDKSGIAMGLGTAAGSFGQFVYAPIGSYFIESFGWANALYYLSFFIAIIVVFAPLLRGKPDSAGDNAKEEQLSLVLKHALSNKSYILLALGFFVCGFHLAFITVHFPPFLYDNNIPSSIAGWAISLIGLCNIIGALAAGRLSDMLSKRYILCFIYAMRSLAILLFIITPISTISVLLFSMAMGFLWLSTVPPTASLVKTMFGIRYMGTLYGVVFLSHQIGSFIGVFLGGVLYDITGDYDMMWVLAIIFGIISSIVHLPIKEVRHAL